MSFRLARTSRTDCFRLADFLLRLEASGGGYNELSPFVLIVEAIMSVDNKASCSILWQHSRKGVSLVVLLILSGCTGEVKTPGDLAVDASESEVSVANSSTVVAGEDARPSGAPTDALQSAKSVPEDFPKDVVVVAGSQVTSFMEAGNKMTLMLRYPEGDVEELVKRYQVGMADQGWKQVASSALGIGTVTNYSKDDRKCTISIGKQGDGQLKVAVMLSSEQ